MKTKMKKLTKQLVFVIRALLVLLVAFLVVSFSGLFSGIRPAFTKVAGIRCQ